MPKADITPFQHQRPAQRITEDTAIEKAETHVRKRLRGYLRKIEELAKGIRIVGTTPKGHVPRELILRDPESGDEQSLGFGLVVYQTEPNLKALQYLSDRAMGRPPQRMELTGDGGGPMEHIIPWRPMTQEEANQVEQVFDVEGEVIERTESPL